MAFKSREQVDFDREAAIAAVDHYTVANADEARKLFQDLRTRPARLEASARREKTERHLLEHPDDLEAKAGLVVYQECDVLTSHLELYEERAVEAAMEVLEGAPSPSATIR